MFEKCIAYHNNITLPQHCHHYHPPLLEHQLVQITLESAFTVGLSSWQPIECAHKRVQKENQYWP